jgi:thiamine biosynthesis lipoprotein
MIEVGGEVKAKGINVQGKTWRIGIDKPVEETDKRVLQAIVNLENLALATSGSYRKFYIKDGKRYSHTIDPFTGKPVKHNLLSVSVFTSSCARADGLATAFMAMGSQKAVDFIRKNTDVQIYMISSGAANDYQIYMSPGMDKFIESVQQQ